MNDALIPATGAQQILDAIDCALDDWTVSGDAMRWTPQQEADRQRIVAREHLRRVQATRVPLPAGEEAARLLGERWIALVDALRPAVAAFAEAVQHSGQQLADAMREAAEAQHRRDAGLPTSTPPPPRGELRDTDPRAYALARLRARGTGPDRQVQHRRPPRTLR